MSFDDTKCPCGDKKERQTMLCDPCFYWLSDRQEVLDYMDESLSLDYRRQAAIVLLTLARGRKRRRA